jgi:hypothetical protein
MLPRSQALLLPVTWWGAPASDITLVNVEKFLGAAPQGLRDAPWWPRAVRDEAPDWLATSLPRMIPGSAPPLLGIVVKVWIGTLGGADTAAPAGVVSGAGVSAQQLPVCVEALQRQQSAGPVTLSVRLWRTWHGFAKTPMTTLAGALPGRCLPFTRAKLAPSRCESASAACVCRWRCGPLLRPPAHTTHTQLLYFCCCACLQVTSGARHVNGAVCAGMICCRRSTRRSQCC